MKIAVSNIAWDVAQDEDILRLLSSTGVRYIDVAPSKYFPDLTKVSDSEIEKVKDWWESRGITLNGMQSLLFGTTGLNVFGTEDSRRAMLEHLDHVCNIAGKWKATKLVFGSPKNRDRGDLNDDQVKDIAVPFFRKLGDLANSHGVTICLEPNPTLYSCNFMTNSRETAEIVKAVDHSHIKMQFDTGAILINGEDPEEILRLWGHLIGHFHISEPKLVPVGDGKQSHEAIAKALKKHCPDSILSIEMLTGANEASTDAVGRAIQFLQRTYV